MGVVIESKIWEPNKTLYIFLFISISISISIFFLPTKSRVANVLDQVSPASSVRFQRNFLLLFSLSSVMEGLWGVFGEYELAYYGLSKDQMVKLLCIGYAASLFVGSFLGILSDLIGHKNLCLLFYALHLFVSICKRVFRTPTIWLASISLSLAFSIFSFSFETWMVDEHEKLGYRQDSVNDMFWLMAFFESASFMGSQVLLNYLIDGNVNKHITSMYNVAVVLAVVAVIYVSQGWKEGPLTASFKNYRMSFHRHVISDRRVLLLSWAQACIHFSVAVFWILWAPTIVADGREVSLGLIYPCLLGSKMLGSTVFPWLFDGPLAFQTEEFLVCAFIIMGLAFSAVAYDYQEIGVLVTLFCMFHACTGVVLPTLARLRTIYVPNEVRGGMMSLSLMPANAALLIFLVSRRYHYKVIGNSAMVGFAAIGLFSAAGCMYVLRKWGKQQLNRNKHNL